MKQPTAFAFPKAPIGQAARKAASMFPSPGLFAHHIPSNEAMLKPGTEHMERPHGSGEGPRNAVER